MAIPLIVFQFLSIVAMDPPPPMREGTTPDDIGVEIKYGPHLRECESRIAITNEESNDEVDNIVLSLREDAVRYKSVEVLNPGAFFGAGFLFGDGSAKLVEAWDLVPFSEQEDNNCVSRTVSERRFGYLSYLYEGSVQRPCVKWTSSRDRGYLLNSEMASVHAATVRMHAHEKSNYKEPRVDPHLKRAPGESLVTIRNLAKENSRTSSVDETVLGEMTAMHITAGQSETHRLSEQSKLYRGAPSLCNYRISTSAKNPGSEVIHVEIANESASFAMTADGDEIFAPTGVPQTYVIEVDLVQIGPCSLKSPPGRGVHVEKISEKCSWRVTKNTSSHIHLTVLVDRRHTVSLLGARKYRGGVADFYLEDMKTYNKRLGTNGAHWADNIFLEIKSVPNEKRSYDDCADYAEEASAKHFTAARGLNSYFERMARRTRNTFFLTCLGNAELSDADQIAYAYGLVVWAVGLLVVSASDYNRYDPSLIEVIDRWLSLAFSILPDDDPRILFIKLLPHSVEERNKDWIAIFRGTSGFPTVRKLLDRRGQVGPTWLGKEYSNARRMSQNLDTALRLWADDLHKIYSE